MGVTESARTPPSTAPAFTVGKAFRLLPGSKGYRGYNKLCNAVTGMDSIRFTGKVNEQDLNFAAIITVNRSRRIKNRHPVFECKTTSRPNLHLKTCGNIKKKTRWNELPFIRSNNNIMFKKSTNIGPGSTCSLIDRQGSPLFGQDLYFYICIHEIIHTLLTSAK